MSSGARHLSASAGLPGSRTLQPISNDRKAILASKQSISPAKAQRRKESLLETRQRFAPLRLCGRDLFIIPPPPPPASNRAPLFRPVPAVVQVARFRPSLNGPRYSP